MPKQSFIYNNISYKNLKDLSSKKNLNYKELQSLVQHYRSKFNIDRTTAISLAIDFMDRSPKNGKISIQEVAPVDLGGVASHLRDLIETSNRFLNDKRG